MKTNKLTSFCFYNIYIYRKWTVYKIDISLRISIFYIPSSKKAIYNTRKDPS